MPAAVASRQQSQSKRRPSVVIVGAGDRRMRRLVQLPGREHEHVCVVARAVVALEAPPRARFVPVAAGH
ncbi:MAG TPA: hypothetical protein VN889_01545, partial [Solirubrobacteraceae bacterium]|nr:hypothetical protein [Solirubrobacteraceae bacterium]